MAQNSWKELTDSLNLPESASEDEVKKAFRAFARTDHPDINPNSSRRDQFVRASFLMSLVKQGKLSPDSVFDEPEEEEDVFADVNAQKVSVKKEAQPIYEPINGKNITIDQTINAELAEKGGVLTIKIEGAALLASNLTRQKNVEVSIKPNSWGRRQITLKGKGRPGLFGGKPGDLIIKIKSEPLKAPLTSESKPKPGASTIKTQASGAAGKNSEKISTTEKIRPTVLPKPAFPPKPYPSLNQNQKIFTDESFSNDSVPARAIDKRKPVKGWRYIAGTLIIVFWLGNIISNNNDLRNSDDAAFRICSATDSLHATIFFDKFYNYENPYEAAIYYDYFTEDIDATDMVSEIEVQYPRIQAEKYLTLKSIGSQLSLAFSRNDRSIVTAMNKIQKECSNQGYPWSE